MYFGLFVVILASLLYLAFLRLRYLNSRPVMVPSGCNNNNNNNKACRIDARVDFDGACFRDHFRSSAIDTMYDMAKARLFVSNSLQDFRAKKKVLEASMRDIEMFLVSRYKGFGIVTGSQLTAAQTEANLEANEVNFVRARHSLHGCIMGVQSCLDDLRTLTSQLRTWMAGGVSEKLQSQARSLISEIEVECDSVIASLNTILSEADSEPVGISDGEFSSCLVSHWCQQRAEVRSKIRLY